MQKITHKKDGDTTLIYHNNVHVADYKSSNNTELIRYVGNIESEIRDNVYTYVSELSHTNIWKK